VRGARVAEAIVMIASGQVVLLVEDDRAVQRAYAEALTAAGFSVLAEADGDWALRTFATRPVDLLVLDLLLPGRGGQQLAEEVRGSERGRTLPLVLVSGVFSSTRGKRQLEERLGPLEWLDKPLEPSRLVAAVQRALGLAEEEPSPEARRERLARARVEAKLKDLASIVDAALGAVEACVVRLSDDPLDRFQDMGLEAEQAHFLGLVDGQRTVAELLALAALHGLAQEDARRLLYALKCAGMIQLGLPGAANYERKLGEGGIQGDRDDVARILAAEERFRDGERLLAQHKLAEARAALEAAVALCPEEAEFHAVLAFCLWSGSGQTEAAAQEAGRMLDRALALDPRMDRAYVFRGHIHKALGRGREAEAELEKARVCNPACADALRELRLLRQ
jgi:CheY-like chemotaxis protein